MAGPMRFAASDDAESEEVRNVRADHAARRIAKIINDRFGAHLTGDEVRGLIWDNWSTLSPDAHRVHNGGPPNGL